MKNVFFMSQKKFQRWDSIDVECRLITYFFLSTWIEVEWLNILRKCTLPIEENIVSSQYLLLQKSHDLSSL